MRARGREVKTVGRWWRRVVSWGVNREGRVVESVVRAWVNSARRGGVVVGVGEGGCWALFQDWAKNLLGGWVRMEKIAAASWAAYMARSWTVLCWQVTESGSRARMYGVPGSLFMS